MGELADEKTETVLDGTGCLTIPGLVNAHCHGAMTLFRGLADDLELMTWLEEHIFPAEARYVAPEMVYYCSCLAGIEMLLGGITCVADGYFHEDAAARAFVDVGLRAVAAQGVIDFPAPGVPDPATNIEAAEKFISGFAGDRDGLVRPAIFAHSPYTCCNDTLVRAKEAARELGTRFFIHVAESRVEQQLIAKPAGSSPVRHLDALGILDADTVCIHCVWVDEADMHILAKRGASVVVCPQSHLKLASGIAPLEKMLAKGITVALGTDGAASNNSLDLFREMDICAKVQKLQSLDPIAVPARKILQAATIGGAKALGFAGSLGRIAPGALADLVMIDLQSPHLTPFYNPDLLVYAGGAGDVRNVIVNGRIVVRDKEITSCDKHAILKQVRKLAATM